MIPQNHPLSLTPQRRRQPPPLLLTEHHTPKLLIHRLRLAIKVTHILINHLQPPRKRTPRLTRPPMTMTRSMHIRPRLMHRTMYQEARRIGRPRHIAANDFARIVDEHHVRRVEKPKVPPQRIRPEGVRVLRVAHADVPAHAFGEVVPREDAEGACHVREEPCAVLVVGGEEWDAGEADALGDGLEGHFFFGFVGGGMGDWLFGGWCDEG